MSFSWSKGLAPLGGACACSLALHLAAWALLDRLPWSARDAGSAPETVRLAARLVEAAAAPDPAGVRRPPVGRPERVKAPVAEHAYLASKELDQRPALTRPVEPAYPNDAYLRDIAGRVMARLFVSETGSVDKVEILLAQPAGQFEEAVRQAFLAARFTPGMKAGRAVKVQLVVEVRYDHPPAVAGR